MLNVTVQVPLDVINAINDQIGRTPALMSRAYSRNMTRLAQRYITRLQVRPGPSFLGITRLMTPRQQRAFWASNGFGGGIPHQRTDAVPDGWQYEIMDAGDGGEASIFNDVPAVRWTEGYDQQPFLAAIGWLYAPPILDEFLEEGQEVAVQTFITISDPFAGVPQP